MRIQMATFNLYGLGLPKTSEELQRMSVLVETLLKEDPQRKLQKLHKGLTCLTPDMYVLSLQEMVPLNIQGFLQNSSFAAEQWSKIIVDVLNRGRSATDPVYIAREPITMFGLALFIFVRQDLNPYITQYDRDNVRSGVVGLGEKGGVAVSMKVGGTSMVFVGGHLASGDENGNLLERRNDWDKIRDNLSFDNDKRMEDHEYVFWMADINSHLSINSTEDSQRVQMALQNQDWQFLINNYDELTKERRTPPNSDQQSMFFGYKEGMITFPPTHKYQPGTQTFVAQTPSFSDRILWRRKITNGPDITSRHGSLLLYDSTQSITVSDHRPVTVVLEIEVQAPSFCPPAYPSRNPSAAIQAPIQKSYYAPNKIEMPTARPGAYPIIPSNNPYDTTQMMTALRQFPDREYQQPQAGYVVNEPARNEPCFRPIGTPHTSNELNPNPPPRYERKVHLQEETSGQNIYSMPDGTQVRYLMAPPEPTPPEPQPHYIMAAPEPTPPESQPRYIMAAPEPSPPESQPRYIMAAPEPTPPEPQPRYIMAAPEPTPPEPQPRYIMAAPEPTPPEPQPRYIMAAPEPTPPGPQPRYVMARAEVTTPAELKSQYAPPPPDPTPEEPDSGVVVYSSTVARLPPSPPTRPYASPPSQNPDVHQVQSYRQPAPADDLYMPIVHNTADVPRQLNIPRISSFPQMDLSNVQWPTFPA